MGTYLTVLMILFPISEVALLIWKRAKQGEYDVQDRRTVRLIWRVIGISIALAVAANWAYWFAYSIDPKIHLILVSFFIIGGTILRWTAILTLGRAFTVNVAVHAEQKIIDTGVYRLIRHPSYTGAIMQFLALALFFRNGLSAFLVVFPITWVFLRRIRQEEEVLSQAFGDEYKQYMSRTKRLIPGVY